MNVFQNISDFQFMQHHKRLQNQNLLEASISRFFTFVSRVIEVITIYHCAEILSSKAQYKTASFRRTRSLRDCRGCRTKGGEYVYITMRFRSQGLCCGPESG